MAYKYESPYDWLTEAAKEWDAGRLYHEVCNLARLLDSDTLQDEFETELARAGYFDDDNDTEESA